MILTFLWLDMVTGSFRQPDFKIKSLASKSDPNSKSDQIRILRFLPRSMSSSYITVTGRQNYSDPLQLSAVGTHPTAGRMVVRE